ncbi:MAG: Pseudouridine-5'-phosphatase [Bogoriella megaspora]|nr:MAG: Pseudouridine-5'-phosphatase [Bogoriella megaspora]
MDQRVPRVRACIFDVDGTLINSEDIYTQIYNKILKSYGKDEYPWSIKAIQQSRGTPGTQRLLAWAGLPLSVEEWRTQEVSYREDFAHCKALPGVTNFLQTLSNASPRIPMAIASSASKQLFDIKTTQIPELPSFFAPELQIFGDDPDMQGRGKKPEPDIFNLALQRINNACVASGMTKVTSEECLVFEDSIAGVEAGRKAGMRVIWIPHDGLARVCRGQEQLVLMGSTEKDGAPPQFTDPTEGSYEITDPSQGASMMSEDGKAEMINSFESFSFDKYGIQVKEIQ